MWVWAGWGFQQGTGLALGKTFIKTSGLSGILYEEPKTVLPAAKTQLFDPELTSAYGHGAGDWSRPSADL